MAEPVKGDTRGEVSRALGISPRTYQKIAEVREAAEADPGKYGDLLALVDAESAPGFPPRPLP